MGDTKYIVYTAHVYKEDVSSKSGQNGPLSSARWHSIECQNTRSSQKLKMLGKKTVLKRVLFISVLFHILYFHSLNSLKKILCRKKQRKAITCTKRSEIACLISFISTKEFINVYCFRITFAISHLQNICFLSKCEPILLKE